MNPSCPVCSEGNPQFEEAYKDYRLYHCLKCDLAFADPMKTGVSFYETDADYALRDEVMADFLKWNFRWDMDEFLKNPPATSGNLLDIGCGTGFFVKRTIDVGFKGYGIDFNERSISIGRKHFGIDTLYKADIEGFKAMHPDLKFDVITMFHVLEHLEEPVKAIGEIKGILKKDGVLVIAVPYRDRWPDPMGEFDYPPNHLTRWSLKSMEYFLKGNGFYMKRHKVENFPLPNISGLIYRYALKFYPKATMKGSLAESGARPDKAQIEKMLRLRMLKIKATNIFGFPLWLLLKALGARGPQLYVEAGLKQSQ